MNDSLIRKTNLFGAWCGVFYCVLLLIGWWVVGGYFPLHKPSAGAAEIAAFYAPDNVGHIRAGLVLVMWGAAIFLPFTVTMADYIARIEGRPGPLTRLMTLSGYSNALLTFLPPLFWLVAAFRSDVRAMELTWLLNDMGWLMFIGAIALVMPMFPVLGVAILSDKSARPVFPRWLAFYSFFTFVMFLPDQLLFFFKSGPFAWNGLFALWIPLTNFCLWFILVFYMIRRDILLEKTSSAATVLQREALQ